MNARREIRMQQLVRTSTTPQLVLSDLCLLCLLVIGRLMALKGGEAAQWQNKYANIHVPPLIIGGRFMVE